MTDKPITDKSLFICTLKKSASVLEKVVKYLSYAIVGLAATSISVYGLIGIYTVLIRPASDIIKTIFTIVGSLPWYFYAGAAGVLAIPVYSFLWCVARELTETDWKSDAADNFAFAFALVLALVLAAIALVLAAIALAFAPIIALALALALVIGIVAADNQTSWYYIFRFPGAVWNHYRKKV